MSRTRTLKGLRSLEREDEERVRMSERKWEDSSWPMRVDWAPSRRQWKLVEKDSGQGTDLE
jgi:hypothetical protein